MGENGLAIFHWNADGLCDVDPSGLAGKRAARPVHAALAAGQLTCTQLTKLYLDRIAAYDTQGPALHAIITVNPKAMEIAYCQAFARWRQAEDMLTAMAEHELETGALITKTSTGIPIQNPLQRIAVNAANDMIRYAAEFGLTPAARARVAGASSGGPCRASSTACSAEQAREVGRCAPEHQVDVPRAQLLCSNVKVSPSVRGST
jgi:P27 family predicted phage terminase small subunit